MRNIFYLLFTLMLLTGLTSCEKDEPVLDLTIGNDSYSVGSGMETSVIIVTGNKDYSISSQDEEIASASLALDQFDFGVVTISGKEKGSTVITLKDNRSGQEKEIPVTVTDAYLSLIISHTTATATIDDQNNKAKIEKDIDDSASLTKEYIYSLVKNDTNTFYVFKSAEDALKGEIYKQGTYAFEASGNVPYLILTYQNSTEEKTYRYMISASSSGLGIIASLFDLNYLRTAKSKAAMTIMESPLVNVIKLTEDLTGLYQPIYPLLAQATLDSYIMVSLPSQTPLPDNLVQ